MPVVIRKYSIRPMWRRERILVMQAAQHRSDVHQKAFATTMSGSLVTDHVLPLRSNPNRSGSVVMLRRDFFQHLALGFDTERDDDERCDDETARAEREHAKLARDRKDHTDDVRADE